MRLDGQDIGILISLWEQGHRVIELDGNSSDNRRRLVRMKRAGLCGNMAQYDDYGPGHHKEKIWGITPDGKEAVNLSEEDHAGAWSEPDFCLDYPPKETKQCDQA